MNHNSPDEPLMHTDREKSNAYAVGFVIGVIVTLLFIQLIRYGGD